MFSFLKNQATTRAYRDIFLLVIMTLGAGCGMIYEYLIAHYAGRILGSVDTAIYGMIGLMIVAMGIGAFYARTVKCAYNGFAWLEALIALTGGVAVLVMAGIFALAYVLPNQLQHTFGLHESVQLQGGPIFALKKIAESFPYVIGLLLGILIGMEIPFIARMREDIHRHHLEHNAGTVYGADYIGAGVGAAIWVLICLKQPIIKSAAFTALLNLVLGTLFLFHFYSKIRFPKLLLSFKAVTGVVLLLVLVNGNQWLNAMSNMLYTDKVVHAQNTRYQNLVITERVASSNRSSIINLYINGHLQFSSSDEIIYHSMLVSPAMLASARQEKILIVGGGDGLAAREVFKWSPESVTLVDLDPVMIELFKGVHSETPEWLNQRLTTLNENALDNPRLNVVYGDAFKVIEEIADKGEKYFDAIIVDLPDPNHPDLNKLYSTYFFAKLSQLLSADGAMVIQSTSPYHSKKAFLSIGKTVEAVGLLVDQYHANVPSFGEWGWTIASKRGLSPKQRLSALNDQDLDHPYLTYGQMMSAFNFSKHFYQDIGDIEVNHLNAPTLYTYHSEGWRRDKGIHYAFD